MAVPPPPITVLDGMIACGLSNVIQVNAGGTSPAQRVASQMFFNNYELCLTMTDKEIDNNFKSFADLPVAEGRIKIMPGIVKMVKAFAQHVAHTLRLELNPEEYPFIPTRMVSLTRQRILQIKFEAENKSEIDGAKPSVFSTTIVWIEWNRAFYNYLKLIPSVRGIPLRYVIRPIDAIDRTPQTLFQDEYILVAPLAGPDFNQDNARAFTLLKALVAGNPQAEALLNANETTRDCRQAHKDLKTKYEGVGITAPARTKAEHDISHMYYSGERPNFTWESFESRLKDAYKTIDDLENRMVYSNAQQLSRLLDAVKADFLQHVKSSITVAMASNPAYTFTDAMTAFKNEVLRKYPPMANGQPNPRRFVRETNSGRGGFGRGGKGGGRGRGRGRSPYPSPSTRRAHPDEKTITLKNGKKIKAHPSYKFNEGDWDQMHKWQQDEIFQARESYKKRRGNGNTTSISDLSREVASLRQQLSEAASVPSQVNVDNDTIATNNDSGGCRAGRRSIIGGRNDQQRKKEMTGMLRWATEMGRVDILHEISLLSQYQASPRQGHMQEALHIFAFLKKKPKMMLYMNSEDPCIEYGDFKARPDEFLEYYRDAEEQLPHRMPKPRGQSVITLAFCDASYAANKKTRRSHSGYVIFVNKSPIKWVSRRQNTLETSAFLAEFISLKQCIEDIEHVRFKLRMFGIPISESHPATYIYCDNDSVVKNSTRVDSTLNKKHSEVAYHFTRWNVAAKVCTLGWIETNYNIADAFTKRLASTVRDFLFGEWTY